MTETRDEILEAAAIAVEESCLTDMMGVLARTKNGQREYEIRMKAVLDTRRQGAGVIRAMKSGQGRDPIKVLRDIAGLAEDSHHDFHLVDAWPLAWKGWLNIECILMCNSNSIPPQTDYKITLTEAGRAELLRNEQLTDSIEPRR